MEASALHLAWLKSAIPPNVGNSGVQFLVVGDCVRAIPWQNKGICYKINFILNFVRVVCST